MPSLLDLCRSCGLKAPADYVIWVPFIVVVTEAGQRELEALAAQDDALAQRLFDASGAGIEALLAGHPKLTKRWRRRGERLLAKGLASKAQRLLHIKLRYSYTSTHGHPHCCQQQGRAGQDHRLHGSSRPACA